MKGKGHGFALLTQLIGVSSSRTFCSPTSVLPTVPFAYVHVGCVTFFLNLRLIFLIVLSAFSHAFLSHRPILYFINFLSQVGLLALFFFAFGF